MMTFQSGRGCHTSRTALHTSNAQSISVPVKLSGEYSNKKLPSAGPIRTDLAQYRELAAFAQFGSELDDDTKERLDQGERIREILKQPQYQPLPVEKQVAIIYAAVKKHLLDLPVDQILDFQKELFELIDTKYPEIFTSIAETKVMDDATEEKLIKAINKAKESFRK